MNDKQARGEATRTTAPPDSTQAHRSTAVMHTDAAVRKAGRLSREDQRRLGDILKRVYDDFVQQGVPDRFRTLLNELDVPKDPGERPGSGLHAQGRGSEDQSDQVAETGDHAENGLYHNKGSHR
ncbi:MAG TPA: NepR family anti-sigma factor [Xanthobacteraceae bacterium]